jgi:hypothetical protein
LHLRMSAREDIRVLSIQSHVVSGYVGEYPWSHDTVLAYLSQAIELPPFPFNYWDLM